MKILQSRKFTYTQLDRWEKALTKTKTILKKKKKKTQHRKTTSQPTQNRQDTKYSDFLSLFFSKQPNREFELKQNSARKETCAKEYMRLVLRDLGADHEWITSASITSICWWWNVGWKSNRFLHCVPWFFEITRNAVICGGCNLKQSVCQSHSPQDMPVPAWIPMSSPVITVKLRQVGQYNDDIQAFKNIVFAWLQ